MLAVIVLVALARITATYSVFNHTADEPYHLLRGMLWISGEPYQHVEHPPLSQACFAVGPYLDGVRPRDTGNKWRDAPAVLYDSPDYFRTLTLARLGNLIFFLWAIAIVWRWAEVQSGPGTALLAVLLFTNLPPVLGHAAVATSDMAITAALAMYVYVLMRWLDEPTPERTVMLGLAAGAALLVKFSALLFLPVASAVTLLIDDPRERPRRPGGWKSCGLQLGFAMLLAGYIVWAGYRFSFGPLRPLEQRNAEFGRHAFADDSLALWADQTLSSLPLPAPEFFEGATWLLRKTERGHADYFLGQPRDDQPSWLFFPVVLSVKTPLPFLALALVGALALLRPRSVGQVQPASQQSPVGQVQPATSPVPSPPPRWQRLVAPGVAAALIVAVLPATINIGVRHILPVYPLLSITAASGVANLWGAHRARWAARSLAVALLAWLLLSSARTRPDYLAYFNELAARHPEKIVVESDLDWGQDLQRLSAELRRRGITQVAIAYFGTAQVDQHDLPQHTRLAPHQRASGWIAISLTRLQIEPGYHWLLNYEPVTTIGRSIRLYYVAEKSQEPEHRH